MFDCVVRRYNGAYYDCTKDCSSGDYIAPVYGGNYVINRRRRGRRRYHD